MIEASYRKTHSMIQEEYLKKINRLPPFKTKKDYADFAMFLEKHDSRLFLLLCGGYIKSQRGELGGISKK